MVGAEASKGVAQSADTSQEKMSAQDDQSTSPQASSSSVAANTTSTPSTSNSGTADSSTASLAANSSSTTKSDDNLSATGKTSSDQTPSGSNQEMITLAQSVRKGLDDDSNFARLDIQVMPENDSLVLRGTVNDAQQSQAIEKKVRELANGKKIDNQLKTQTK
jgi:osmotically-inducible protein OsmY